MNPSDAYDAERVQLFNRIYQVTVSSPSTTLRSHGVGPTPTAGPHDAGPMSGPMDARLPAMRSYDDGPMPTAATNNPFNISAPNSVVRVYHGGTPRSEGVPTIAPQQNLYRAGFESISNVPPNMHFTSSPSSGRVFSNRSTFAPSGLPSALSATSVLRTSPSNTNSNNIHPSLIPNPSNSDLSILGAILDYMPRKRK